MLTEEAFQRFKTMYEAEIGTIESDDLLRAMAIVWLEGMDVTYRPIKKEWVTELENPYIVVK